MSGNVEKNNKLNFFIMATSKRKREEEKEFFKKQEEKINFIGKKLKGKKRGRESKNDKHFFENFSDRMVS
jgi:capsule polysaccharide export protein KpsC/LpsZ